LVFAVFGQEPYELDLVQNSATISQAVAINRQGDVLGIKEVTEKDITRQVAFYRSAQGDEILVPKLPDYTNNAPEALSDSGLVVGLASRTFLHPEGSLAAFAWDSTRGKIVQLPKPEGDTGAYAHDVSADGTRVTGYCVGANPARQRPCLWYRTSEPDGWQVRVLETIEPMNPFLQTSRVVISPDGKRIAASVTVKHLSPIAVDSSLMFWEEKDSDWIRRPVCDEQPKLRDINDEGVVVGSALQDNQTRACLIRPDGKLEWIEPLPGDHSNVATGISRNGLVVGYSDDPPGQDGGSTAFIYVDGKVRPLEMPLSVVDSAALAINADGIIAGYLIRMTEEKDAPAVAFIRRPK
jgi:probable HAF family extracellular repeat protein